MAGHFHAALEQDQGRQSLHLLGIAGGGVGIGLELANLEALAVLTGGPVHQGGHQAARAAPGGPDIHQHRTRGVEHFGLEIGVGELENGHVEGGCWGDCMEMAVGGRGWP